MKSNYYKTKYRKGFALLFSIIVVSVVVITTLAVSSIVRRGLELTSIGERSMEAFFAADAGIECALYWDIKERAADGSSKFRLSSGGASGGGSIECLGLPVSVTSGSSDSTLFRINGNGVCADVTVTITNSGLNTVVQSRGFNTCDTSDPGRIERGLRATY